MEKVSFPDMHKYTGGKATYDNDFLVALEHEWKTEALNAPYRAEGAAIVLCTSGTATASVNMRELKIEKGSVMLYGRRSIIEFLDISEDLKTHFVFFSGSFVQNTLLDLKSVLPIFKYITENLSELIILSDDEFKVMCQFYELIYSTMDFERASIANDLMAAFMRSLGEIYNRRIGTTPRPKTRQEEYLENFLKEVAINHKKERSVKYYADALHITPKYLSTVIKEVSGKSAASWINDFVIQEAKVLLKYSGKSIQEITYELNFSTQSFFGKYFKRHTDMSPSEYRASE